MSLLPDFIFRTVIVRGMRTIRQDNRFLDQLFRNLDQQSAADMREFFQKNKIYIDINYPREALKLPAIIILMKSETENQAWLGDIENVGSAPNIFSYDSELSETVLGGTASVSSLDGQGSIVFGPYTALNSTLSTLTIAIPEWHDMQFFYEQHTIHIVSGKGSGQQRVISSNTENNITVKTNWDIVPDNTSVFVIRSLPSKIIGEPRSLYSNQDKNVYERLGSMYALNYQLQVIGPSPELTIYLHAIVKAIFTLSRTFLEGQGILNMRMGATDFVPKTEYQPDFAYMRALNIEFLSAFDVFSELGDLATTLKVAIEANAVK